MLKVTRSRRVAALKPSDYDHEIATVDHDGRGPDQVDRSLNLDATTDVSRVSTTSGLLPHDGQEEAESSRRAGGEDTYGDDPFQERPGEGLQHEQQPPDGARGPSIGVQAPTPHHIDADAPHSKSKPQPERETAVDVLYENERGGFLCGVALFSAQALGGLDATPWTNAYHNPSPTSIHTAQVPDPSWEWLWPEWHINHQEGMDEFGWEYSFAFSKKFSWHGPTWWNSFVRRRAWTRKRIKRTADGDSADPHMLNTDYFTVRPASDRIRRSQASLASRSSRVPSKASMTQVSSIEVGPEQVDIDDIETLMQFLRLARIDREKLEAVENYLEHAIDLSQLEREMHDIMSILIFQASRRLLLGRLMQIYDETTHELAEKGTGELRDRKDALQAAIKHADEEVRKLAYWSDVKQMAESGESGGAVDSDRGWQPEWRGVDQSGPAQPNSGKLPG